MGDDDLEGKKKPLRKEPQIFRSFDPERYWTIVRKDRASVIPDIDKLEKAIAEHIEKLKKVDPTLPELPVEQQRLLEDIYDEFKSDPEKAGAAKAETESILRGAILPEFFLTAPDDERRIREMAEERGIKIPSKR